MSTLTIAVANTLAFVFCVAISITVGGLIGDLITKGGRFD